jgi:Fur family peroxide stress response transcriptional regulator
MPHPPFDPETLRLRLESAGRRPTPQRLAVYGQLCRDGGHPTAEDVYRGVRASLPRISLATVYKALETLVGCGMVRKLAAEDGSARYDARGEDHYHFRCLTTGAVYDLPTPFDPDLIARLDPRLKLDLERRGFHITGYRLELVGHAGDGPARTPEE